MESSEITNQEVINLGKAIITELGMIIDCNTPARWLVHYIAENIHKSESCQGEEKESAERKCVDAIFKLWHHRSELPRGINPFSEFDSVFRGLSRLDNSSQKPYFNELVKISLINNPSVMAVSIFTNLALTSNSNFNLCSILKKDLILESNSSLR